MERTWVLASNYYQKTLLPPTITAALAVPYLQFAYFITICATMLNAERVSH